MKKIIIETNLPSRVDFYLMNNTEYSRSKIQKLLLDGTILVNGQSVKNGYMVKEKDVITIGEVVPEVTKATPEAMDLDIIYEDDDVIVVNKESGMVVHPAVGNRQGTLVNGLLYHSQLSTLNGDFRPGIVHRIDADTSGLLMIAKNDFSHAFLAEQLKEKTVTRKYIALVWGVIENDTGTIDAPLGRDDKDRKKMAVTDRNSKEAITHFTVLERFKTTTLIELKLETGRTHQIRVHMNYINHAVVNDPVYGRHPLFDQTGQCLHAKVLGFIHPRTKQYLEFDSELPPCFVNILDHFKDS